jgi:hypothetical protein
MYKFISKSANKTKRRWGGEIQYLPLLYLFIEFLIQARIHSLIILTKNPVISLGFAP